MVSVGFAATASAKEEASEFRDAQMLCSVVSNEFSSMLFIDSSAAWSCAASCGLVTMPELDFLEDTARLDLSGLGTTANPWSVIMKF